MHQTVMMLVKKLEGKLKKKKPNSKAELDDHEKPNSKALQSGTTKKKKKKKKKPNSKAELDDHEKPNSKASQSGVSKTSNKISSNIFSL
ncbi:hypothetical protein RHGRI_002684 [Rhododendron griersonianum]|uniref:Uncharacterized protein n=1 Tax=Rhododendron griersonianum TaxID=479676 RepID=A0AAV6LSS3_9ERIC|nr:hypothetical protein RHGRI_002684 [Rhododendron griersonianum]